MSTNLASPHLYADALMMILATIIRSTRNQKQLNEKKKKVLRCARDVAKELAAWKGFGTTHAN